MALPADYRTPYDLPPMPIHPVSGRQQFVLALVVILFCGFGQLSEGVLYSVLFAFGVARR